MTKTAPKRMPTVEGVLRNIWPRIKVGDGCWEWTGSVTNDGYAGSVPVNGMSGPLRERYLPHRLMFQLFKWDIPEGLTIDHICKNRRCLNPDHMEAVNIAENLRRAHKRAYCYRGHPQVPENRYIVMVYGKPRERCKPCIKSRTEEEKAKRHARGLKKRGRKPKSSEQVLPQDSRKEAK